MARSTRGSASPWLEHMQRLVGISSEAVADARGRRADGADDGRVAGRLQIEWARSPSCSM